MNLNQIQPGTDYAFFPSRGRGEEFRWPREGYSDSDRWCDSGYYYDKYCVYRVKAIRAFSKREEGNKRDTGYVDVFWLTDEGEFKYDEGGSEVVKTVRCRDLATLWEDYEDMRDYEQTQRDLKEQRREQERAERQAAYEREEAERQRIRKEQEEARERERQRIENERREYAQRIERRFGLPTGSVKTGGTFDTITLNKEMIDAALNGGSNGVQ